jgi:hypothetical protein
MLYLKKWRPTLGLLMMLLMTTVIGSCGSSGGDNKPAVPSTDLSGTWTAEETINGNCRGDTYPVTQTEILVVTQSGNQITRSIPSRNAQISGTISGNTIKWSGTFDEDGGQLRINFSGTLLGDSKITGSGDWTWSDGIYTCQGTSSAVITKSIDQTNSVTGLWEGTWQSEEYGLDRTFSADILQNGSTLSGKIDVPDIGLINTDLKGTATNNTIVFGDINDEIVFTGTLASHSAASGTYEYPALDDNGSWQATKTAGAPSENISWPMTDMGFAFGAQDKIVIGDGRNDGVLRVYTGDSQTGGSSGNIYEFSYTGGQWQNNAFGDFDTEYGGDNLSHITGLAIGSARNDRVNRVYGCGYHAAEFEYGFNNFTGTPIDTDIQWANDLIIGDVHGDGQSRIYLSDWNDIYELTYTNGSWLREAINTSEVDIKALKIVDGRNDGVMRLYAATRFDNHVYEYTWLNGQWQVQDCGAVEGAVAINAMDAGVGRNDGVNRIYLAANGGLFELSYDGSDWQINAIGSASYASSLALGPGRNDGDHYLYVAEDQDSLAEYAFNNGWVQTSVLVSNQAINAVAVGDGKNNDHTAVYATSSDNHVYEFTAR